MSNIDEKVQQIRSAIYGKDVREAIASSIEGIYEVAISAREDITEYLKDAIKINDAAILATDNANVAAQQAATNANLANEAAIRANEAADKSHTILQGSSNPNAEIGRNGDFYINTAVDSYHLFYKKDDIWEDKGALRGIDGNNKFLVGNSLEIAESKELFIQTITQAQAIAETRGITVNEYDARLPMNQVRVSDEIHSQSLDVYLEEKFAEFSKTTNITFLNEWRKNTVEPLLSKIGNTVFFYCDITGGNTEINTQIGFIPEGYRPEAAFLATILTDAGNGGCTIYNDGEIKILKQPPKNEIQIHAIWKAKGA